MHNLDLTISDISKIEGKASCDISIKEGKIESVKFKVAEYKRFYTQAIRGKDILALPQLTSRICGTCSNAHLLCAIKAVEDALSLVPSEQTMLLRQLLNYGLIIRDHALHLCVFVMPDIFGKDSILDFDENNPQEHKFLDDTFSLKSAGNNLSKAVGGRSVHAPYPAVGGFIRLPKQNDLVLVQEELREIRPVVLDLIKLFATRDSALIMPGIDFAAFIDEKYSFLSGNIVTSQKMTIPKEKYRDCLNKVVNPYSQASAYKLNKMIFMVGALARLNLAKDKLHKDTRESISEYLDLFPSNNMFFNNLAQAVEILHAVDASIEIINNINIRDEKPVIPERKEGIGIGIIEAPRGILYYRLVIDSSGKVKDGQIVVPTGQNQICIEESIKRYLTENIANLDDKEKVELTIERIIRAFDPCISCASHFLKVNWL